MAVIGHRRLRRIYTLRYILGGFLILFYNSHLLLEVRDMSRSPGAVVVFETLGSLSRIDGNREIQLIVHDP